MFSKDIISQSIIDAVSSVLQLDEKLNVKKRTTDTLAGRVKIPAASGDNEHTAYKVELNAEELARVDEILDTSPAIKSYLDKSAVKRDALRNSTENKISHPDYDKTSNKIRKSFDGSDKAINKWNTINRTRSTSESVELEEENAVDKVTMDIPLLIRIMEYSKEDAKSDMDLHKVAENLVEYSKSGKTLTMACYNHVVGINEAKRPEDDSVPFITNEDGLAGHVNSIKKLAKHTFKKVKANESYYDDDPDVARADRELARMKAKPIKADQKTDPSKEMSKLSKRAPKEDADELDKDLTHKEEFELGESVRSDRKKSTMAVLDRIYKKASENTKLEQNRKISPKLPKKELEESEKPTTAHFTDPKGIKRKQPNDPFYPEYDKHEQGKPSEAKKARFAKLGLKAEEVIDEAKKDSYQVYHPSYSSAVQHAEKHLNKQGFDIHPDDWFHHINAGPSKPAEGKTVSLHIPLHKDGVPSKKVAHIQVYNRGNDIANNHELNMYHN